MKKIITVEPVKRSKVNRSIPNIKKRRVAGYARVSTDQEEQQSSYDTQMAYYQDYIASRHDWEFVKMYSDGGWSALIGEAGWRQISVMLAAAYGFYRSSWVLATKAAGFAATGIGVVWSVLSALGAGGSLISAVFNTGAIVSAIFYMMRDNGYQYADWSILSFAWSMVKPL